MPPRSSEQQLGDEMKLCSRPIARMARASHCKNELTVPPRPPLPPSVAPLAENWLQSLPVLDDEVKEQ